MNKLIFCLQPLPHPSRSRAKAAIDAAADGDKVAISPPGKTRDQEERYHAMIGDIAKVALFMGKKQHKDDWKRLLVDAFAKAMRDAGTPLHHDGRVMPSLDFERVVQLGIQTKDFYIAEASQFIEYLYSFGAENDVKWSDPQEYKA
ncbi:MAG: recombination protein NinB [Sterolibacterium sp.]